MTYPVDLLIRLVAPHRDPALLKVSAEAAPIPGQGRALRGLLPD